MEIIKKWSTVVLVLLGLVVCIKFVYGYAQPYLESYEVSQRADGLPENVRSVLAQIAVADLAYNQQLKAAAKRILNEHPTYFQGGGLKKVGELPDDVTIYRNEAVRLADLIRARNSYNAIWSRSTSWPESILVTSKSPVIRYVGPEVSAAWPEGKPGKFEVMLIKDDQFTIYWIDLDERVPEKYRLAYWQADMPIRVDYATAVRGSNLPNEIIPAAQRTVDGKSYHMYFVYREDVSVVDESLPKVQWGRGILRSNTEAGGKRQIIDRYMVVLRRGQTSDRLVYRPPYLESWETQDDWMRNWRIRCEGGSLLAKVNGQQFVFEKDRNTDTSEVERDDGSLILEVTLSRDANAAELPVEFVYYRQRRI